VSISIDMAKYEADAAWDGIKGYVTNTGLSKDDVIGNYGNLWFIERAFRMNKFDLAVRPIYHRLRYYAKKVELLNTVWDTYDMFYATYAMGGNASGDGALTEEYCQWTEFRYELYCFANPY
ncbi:MAG: hypothetical protein IKI41_04105, partial [Clostridia bacterium]|nr:hypothetical protein [Clostridia bacterium]